MGWLRGWWSGVVERMVEVGWLRGWWSGVVEMVDGGVGWLEWGG